MQHKKTQINYKYTKKYIYKAQNIIRNLDLENMAAKGQYITEEVTTKNTKQFTRVKKT